MKHKLNKFMERRLVISEIDGDTSFHNVSLKVSTGGIIGVSRVSGMRILNEIQNTFFNHSQIKKIFELENNGLRIKPIQKKILDDAVRGFSKDIQCMAYAYYLAINGAEAHYVDMTFTYETLNSLSISELGLAAGTKGKYTDDNYGGGVNTSYGMGTLSVVILDSKADIGDFTYSPNGVDYPRRSMPAELLAHEMLGHGYGRVKRSISYGHADAVQMSNLYWRTRGYINFYRNGSWHGTQVRLNSSQANSIPNHFIYR